MILPATNLVLELFHAAPRNTLDRVGFPIILPATNLVLELFHDAPRNIGQDFFELVY